MRKPSRPVDQSQELIDDREIVQEKLREWTVGEIPVPESMPKGSFDMGDPADIETDKERFQSTYGHRGFFPLEDGIVRRVEDMRLPHSINYRINAFFQKAVSECGDIRRCFLAIAEFRKSRDKEKVVIYTLWLCISMTKSPQKKGFRSLMTRELYEMPPQNELLWSTVFDINKFAHPKILAMLENKGFWSSSLGPDSDQVTYYDRPRLGTHYFVAVCEPEVVIHKGIPYIWVQHQIAPFWKQIKPEKKKGGKKKDKSSLFSSPRMPLKPIVWLTSSFFGVLHVLPPL